MISQKRKEINKAIELNNYWMISPKKTSKSLQIDAVVEDLVDSLKASQDDAPKRSDYLKKLKTNMRVIVLNLYYAYVNDNERYIAYRRDSGAYKNDPTYRGFQFGYRNVKRVTDFLIDMGYIENRMGHTANEKFPKANIAKMRATKKLIDLIKKHQGDAPDKEIIIVEDTQYDEVIIMKGKKPRSKVVVKEVDGKKKKVTVQPPRKAIQTRDTPAVRKMRENLRFINTILEQTTITLDITPEELRELNKRLNKDSDPYKQAVDYSRKALHRAFVDGNLQRGGRFYGGWWQNVPSKTNEKHPINYRSRILINDVPTVEVDYSGYHPRILYGLNGLSFPDDPYTLEGYPDNKIMRDFLKAFLLTIINAERPEQAFRGIHKKVHKDKKVALPDEIESTSNAHLEPILDALLDKHQAISEFIFSGYWHTLQYIDSQIAEIIMLSFAQRGFPCLPVHDSFIVDFKLEEELKEVMEEVFSHNFKKGIPVKDNIEEMLEPWDAEKFENKLASKILKDIEDGSFDREELEALVNIAKEAVPRHRERLKKIEEGLGSSDTD